MAAVVAALGISGLTGQVSAQTGDVGTAENPYERFYVNYVVFEPVASTPTDIPDGALHYARSPIATPDNTVAHYDASQLSLNDGDTVSVWPDEQGDNDLDIQTGSPTYVESAINGNPAIAFDGDGLEGTGLSVTQPNTTYVVFEYQGGFDGGRVVSSVTSNQLIVPSSNSNNWRIYAGGTLDGSNDLGIQQMTAVFDGGNSIIREDGVETAVGDAGTTDLGGLSVGYDSFGGGDYADVYVSEIVVVNSGSVDLDFETQLLEKWGITA
jgi:hypothetical protein